MPVVDFIPLIPAEEQERRVRRENSPDGELWDLLDAVKDPEIPVLSLWELGVLQDVERTGEEVIVTITPTYSGCPAMTAMAEDLVSTLANAGYQCEVVTRLSPAWTTTWMSDDARRKLFDWGIAPPASGDGEKHAPGEIACPNCACTDVTVISEFGSTACKALYRCSACGEPFDYFKPI